MVETAPAGTDCRIPLSHNPLPRVLFTSQVCDAFPLVER